MIFISTETVNLRPTITTFVVFKSPDVTADQSFNVWDRPSKK